MQGRCMTGNRIKTGDFDALILGAGIAGVTAISQPLAQHRSWDAWMDHGDEYGGIVGRNG